jgi:UDP-2,3-diacylglucosamine pyrophosphatase LpxH
LRQLSDDTLVVILSDSHIGGDGGRDIFESPDGLTTLFDELGAHPGPLELVLAGDFYDFLRIAEVPAGSNRAEATICRPEYGRAFDSLRRLGQGKARTIVYLPGNHDAETWWNPAIRATLGRAGLVHEFALSYAASFASEPERIVYCEHGNQFDPANARRDYADPLDTPLGDHIVTDVVPRIPTGRTATALHMREVDRVFPLTLIPEWLAGRLFYDLVARSVRWLVLPLLALFAGSQLLAYASRGGSGPDELLVQVVYDVLAALILFGTLLLVLRWTALRAIRSATTRLTDPAAPDEPVDAAVAEIRARLEAGGRPPLADELAGEIAVFVSGHTHAPSLIEFAARTGGRGVLVNSGCWLRQLQPVPAHLRGPHVFVGRFVQTHVRIYRSPHGIEVELWEHPRPSRERLPLAERIAIAGRMPTASTDAGEPRVRARRTLPGPEPRAGIRAA